MALIVVGFTAFGFLSAQTAEQKKLKAEYDALLNRVRYAEQCGFCFDGQNSVDEVKTQGGENTFFVEEKNIYLQVKNKKNSTVYYTRCFDLVETNGSLAVNADYVLTQNVRLDGHWNLFTMGNKLNATVCTDKTCKNTQIELYEINAKPVSVTDGIFLTFPSGTEKKAENANISTQSKGMPQINLADEKKNADILMKKMRSVFSLSQCTQMQTDLDTAFKKVSK